MKIPLLLGISLLATAAGKAQQPQAEKPPEAPAAGPAPSPAPGDTAHPDQSRRPMEHAPRNDDAVYCYGLTSEQEAKWNARAERSRREYYWQTIQKAKLISSRLKHVQYMRERESYYQQAIIARRRGEQPPPMPPRPQGIPYFLVAVPIKPAG